MSASQLKRLLASADGLLTNEQCSMLLDIDFFDNDDLLKTFPSAAPKSEFSKFQEQDDGSSSLYPPSPPETKPSPAEIADDILQQLEKQYKQENVFPNWLEEKVELPIFENISQVPERVEPQANDAYCAPPVQHTEELLREFETVYGAVELTHLTPPQSPPGPATQLLLTYAHQAQCGAPAPFAPALTLTHPQHQHQHQWQVAAPSAHVLAPAHEPAPTPAEYDRELEAVEELVRFRAAQLASPQPSGDSASGSGSPHSSPPSSPRSSCTDEEWSAPSRSKPYSRSVDDRRSRKKEQNKNAATRYRQKKKAEIDLLLNEEQILRQHHNDLGDKCSDLQREIRYLKGLMRDLYKAKGLIK